MTPNKRKSNRYKVNDTGELVKENNQHKLGTCPKHVGSQNAQEHGASTNERQTSVNKQFLKEAEKLKT
jgi:hypothetical protein